ncbi:MAG: sugar-transfer associated ATP-grasp domain-containing protein [Ascidiaceihabitans sp.]|nr:sugar-transfer associated ATP-grasp domain-containing protein [Ascidiaceihabitans sp.]
MTTATLDNTLLEKTAPAAVASSPAIVQVAKEFGVSPIKQLRQSLALRLGKNKLTAKDYYAYGLYDPAMSAEARREYVGITSNIALNARLSPRAAVPTAAFVGNKVLYTSMLRQLGIATTETLAVASTHRHFGTLPTLRDAEAIKTFLKDASNYPVFGKPAHGSESVGSVLLISCNGTTLTLGNGKTVDLEGFCKEVTAKYAGGYLFQKALVQHETLANITGKAIGCVRIVTAMDGEAPRPVYSVWKIPAANAMSDNFWQDGSMLAHIDLDSGVVQACRQGSGLDTVEIKQHPKSGAAVVGTQMPDWQAAIDLARQAHAIFPEFGVCGWDIAMTDEGPKIVECNDNPSHSLYQLAARRGVLHTGFSPIWDAVSERQQAKIACMKKIAK